MHDVKALIGLDQALSNVKLRFPSIVVCPLVQGFALAPITKSLAADLASAQWGVDHSSAKASVETFPGLGCLASELSMNGKVAYMSTEFFGGDGGQDAMVWENGTIIFALGDGPGSSHGWPNSPVSQALRKMGVIAEVGKDEFDTVGLGKHRSTERWAAEYAPAI